jgi:acetyl esterase/lipase
MPRDDILSLAPPPADERVPYGSDAHQFGDLRLPKGNGPHPVVMNIHGGFWRNEYDLGHAGHLCAALTAKGVATWNLEYRRIGNPGGGWPGTLDDVQTGAACLETIAAERSLDLKRVVATGHSAGGHLVLWLAKQNTIALRGVVALAPVADLRRAWELKLSNTVVADLLGGSDRTGAAGCRATRSARHQRRHSAVGDQPPLCRRREKKCRRFAIDRSNGRRTFRADRSAIERMVGARRGRVRTSKLKRRDT